MFFNSCNPCYDNRTGLCGYLNVYVRKLLHASLCSVNCRIRSCLSQLNQADITNDEKQELDEALHREVRQIF